VKQKERDRELL